MSCGGGAGGRGWLGRLLGVGAAGGDGYEACGRRVGCAAGFWKGRGLLTGCSSAGRYSRLGAWICCRAE